MPLEQELQEDDQYNFMATSPFGGFANLAPAQLQVAQNRAATANPLDALIQAFTQGQALQQLPQVQAEQVLTRQLNNALLAQKLQDLQNPNAAISREFQKQLVLGSLNPATGITVSPTGLEGTVVATPSAIGQTEAALDQALAANPNLAIPTAAAGAPITPIINPITGRPTGLSRDVNIPRALKQQTLNDQIALANARAAASGEAVEYFTQIDGTVGIRPKRVQAGTVPVATTLQTTTGEAAKELPKATKGAGPRPLTETARSALLTRAGKFGVISSDQDLDKFRNEAGDLNIEKLSVAAGRAEREGLEAEKEAKLNQAPAEVKSKVAAYQAVQKDLERLRAKLDEELVSGDIPSGFQDIISSSLAEAPGNFFTRAFQRFVLQPAQSKTAATNERLRGAVSASIGRAIAGASLTGTEKQNLIPFSPQPGDSFERLLEKSASLEQFLNNQIEGLTTPISTTRQSVSSPVATPGINPRGQNPINIGRFTVTPQ